MGNDWNRREFIKRTSAAAIATMGLGAPMTGLLSSCTGNRKASRADSVILLYMSGGMAHTETFDPKKLTPYTKGMQADSVLSTFKAVHTVLNGINFSEGLESLGKIMDKGTLIRSYVAAD